MSQEFNYTALAQRFSARFPVTAYLGIQINFWVLANILLGVILYLQALSVSETFHLPGGYKLAPVLAVAGLSGILYGLILGLTDTYLDKRAFRNQPLGKVILLKAAISLTVIIGLLSFIRLVFPELYFSSSIYAGRFKVSHQSWKYLFYILVIYNFFMTLLISFINQVNKKYGPGILVPLLLGKYRNPREEERVFMFMDLKSSTSIAELLGHLQYSSFIRDSFMDINQVLHLFHAEIYQYVGDEIVISWRTGEDLEQLPCVRFFFACEKQFAQKAGYYLKNYGTVPQFKAGLHMGKVTAVEIGEIKRDIAYHGDTLNTAARIQSMCNEYHKKLLVSGYFFETTQLYKHFEAEKLGSMLLKGKNIPVEIWSVEDSGH
jgi:adenylate cyclase